MGSSCSQTEVMKCIQIGLLCVQHDAVHRPTMGDVVAMLTGCLDVPQPTFPDTMSPYPFDQPVFSDDDERESQSSIKSEVWGSDIEQKL